MRAPSGLRKGVSLQKTLKKLEKHRKRFFREIFQNLRYVALCRKNLKWPSNLGKRFVPVKNQNKALRLKKLLEKSHSAENR